MATLPRTKPRRYQKAFPCPPKLWLRKLGQFPEYVRWLERRNARAALATARQQEE